MKILSKILLVFFFLTNGYLNQSYGNPCKFLFSPLVNGGGELPPQSGKKVNEKISYIIEQALKFFDDDTLFEEVPHLDSISLDEMVLVVDNQNPLTPKLYPAKLMSTVRIKNSVVANFEDLITHIKVTLSTNAFKGTFYRPEKNKEIRSIRKTGTALFLKVPRERTWRMYSQEAPLDYPISLVEVVKDRGACTLVRNEYGEDEWALNATQLGDTKSKVLVILTESPSTLSGRLYRLKIANHMIAEGSKAYFVVGDRDFLDSLFLFTDKLIEGMDTFLLHLARQRRLIQIPLADKDPDAYRTPRDKMNVFLRYAATAQMYEEFRNLMDLLALDAPGVLGELNRSKENPILIQDFFFLIVYEYYLSLKMPPEGTEEEEENGEMPAVGVEESERYYNKLVPLLKEGFDLPHALEKLLIEDYTLRQKSRKR